MVSCVGVGDEVKIDRGVLLEIVVVRLGMNLVEMSMGMVVGDGCCEKNLRASGRALRLRVGTGLGMCW